jgi:hypothetical protein
MTRGMKLSIVASLLWFIGCATAPMPTRQFIPMGASLQLTAKQPSDVQIFADAAQVPYSYIQVGHITPEGDANHHPRASDQIAAIRALAATHGADAVIVSKQILLKGGTVHSPAEGIIHRAEIALYSGMAIIKSTSTAIAALPMATSIETVSIGDLFAVPENYLHKTVQVEGTYNQLTVGSQATGFYLASMVNNQLELLCAYRNTDLDEMSRRALMNKPNKTNFRIEGHLVHSSEGAAKEAGLSSTAGYEFVVTRIPQ